MRSPKFAAVALPLVCLLSCTLRAQTPPNPSGAIRNGNFERSVSSPNLWAGVDSGGTLAGFTASQPMLDPSGSLPGENEPTPMPVSVAVGDLNGDKRPDIMAADPVGYIRIYFNAGTAQEPKFGVGELSLPFLSRSEGDPPWVPGGLSSEERNRWLLRWVNRRQGVRLGLYDSGGKLSFIAGNYFGDIYNISNEGGATSPRFSQPKSLVKDAIPTMKDPNFRWGNVFAPVYFDWNGDNRPDLLLGEGSYSANNVHLFINNGSAAAPVFSEDKRQALALGQGRLQLTPAMADFNNDGKLDILVIDRAANITVYLRPATWAAGNSIPPSGYLAKAGGLTPETAIPAPTTAYSAGSGLNTLATGDLNGDGLFDLVFGRNNGRIAWAANKGTKEQPKFDPPVDLKGEKPTPETWKIPTEWDIDVGVKRGNYFAYANCVTIENDPEAKPVEGKSALKFGYAEPQNKIVPQPAIVFPAPMLMGRKADRVEFGDLLSGSSERRSLDAPSNFFMMRNKSIELDIGKTYIMSFQVKGAKVRNGKVNLAYSGYKKLGESRVEKGERGAAKITHDHIYDRVDIPPLDFKPGSGWSTVTKEFKVQFTKQPDLNSEPKTSGAVVEIIFEMDPPDGALYMDDFKIVPK